jgi:hypothetical protein
MFYIKRRQPCGKTIPIEITTKIRSPLPGVRSRTARGFGGALRGREVIWCAASVLCSRCTAKRAEAAGRGPRTYEGIERLTRLLLRPGM